MGSEMCIRDSVQREAHLPQERLCLPQLAQLGIGEKTVTDQFIQGLGAEMPLGDPADRLDVAQAARAGLHVRFEVVTGVMVAVMAVSYTHLTLPTNYSV